MTDKSTHWNDVYQKRAPSEVSWFQPEATTSLTLVADCGLPETAAIIDVGAGASTLVDGLIARGYTDITLLDIAASALESTRRRLQNAPVEYVTTDITTWTPARAYDLWHDRAVFHFLTERTGREAYRAVLAKAVRTGGQVILGTFAMDGPERCSGLPVRRYSAETLTQEFGGLLRPVAERVERHRTPAGSEQSFVFVRFQRV